MQGCGSYLKLDGIARQAASSESLEADRPVLLLICGWH